MGLREHLDALTLIEIRKKHHQLDGKRLRSLRMQLHLRGHRDPAIRVTCRLRDMLDRPVEARRPSRAEKILRRKPLGRCPPTAL